MNFILGFDLATSSVDVVSDLYFAGRTEDGAEFHAERFHVQLTLPDGRRLRHASGWNGTSAGEYSEEGDGPFFPDLRPAARAKAERLAARVAAAGRIDESMWDEVDPVYGSGAYVRNGTEFRRIAEEKAGVAYGTFA